MQHPTTCPRRMRMRQKKRQKKCGALECMCLAWRGPRVACARLIDTKPAAWHFAVCGVQWLSTQSGPDAGILCPPYLIEGILYSRATLLLQIPVTSRTLSCTLYPSSACYRVFQQAWCRCTYRRHSCHRPSFGTTARPSSVTSNATAIP